MAFEIREEDGKQAIFKDGKRITEWFDWIYEDGLVSGTSDFFVAMEYEYIPDPDDYEYENEIEIETYALYEYKDGKVRKIIGNVRSIFASDFLKCKSDYFVVSYHNIFGETYSLYHYDRTKCTKKEILCCSNLIFKDGLISGQSDYFVARELFDYAIYEYKEDYDNAVKIADFEKILTDGLVKGQSSYFIAKKNGKYAIYEYKNGKINKITGDFDDIFTSGLVQGKSNYFMTNEDGKYSIYHKLLDKEISYTSKFADYNQNKKLTKLPLFSGRCGVNSCQKT